MATPSRPRGEERAALAVGERRRHPRGNLVGRVLDQPRRLATWRYGYGYGGTTSDGYGQRLLELASVPKREEMVRERHVRDDDNFALRPEIIQ